MSSKSPAWDKKGQIIKDPEFYPGYGKGSSSKKKVDPKKKATPPKSSPAWDMKGNIIEDPEFFPGYSKKKDPARGGSPSKSNGKSESFGKWFARKYKELGEGKTADWTDPKTGKKRSILLTHDKAKLAPKKEAKGLGSKIKGAVKAVQEKTGIGTETSPARKKIALGSKSSAPDTGINRKRGARQKSRMRKKLRADTQAKAKPKVDPYKPKAGASAKEIEAAGVAEMKRLNKERASSGKKKGGSVKKSGYAEGGPVASEKPKPRYTEKEKKDIMRKTLLSLSGAAEAQSKAKGKRTGGSSKGLRGQSKPISSGRAPGKSVGPKDRDAVIGTSLEEDAARSMSPARPVNMPGTDPFKQKQLKRPTTGLKHGGKVRGVGAAKRGFGRGRIV